MIRMAFTVQKIWVESFLCCILMTCLNIYTLCNKQLFWSVCAYLRKAMLNKKKRKAVQWCASIHLGLYCPTQRVPTLLLLFSFLLFLFLFMTIFLVLWPYFWYIDHKSGIGIGPSFKELHCQLVLNWVRHAKCTWSSLDCKWCRYLRI